ncbi:MBL fold metallo-hydrolase [Methylocapsa acidiphila]|uniref:MBL fold metallo-hydrolase n=1 Tax=Methylocapsa acidiphila TaxID=133552 RepID=UPI00042978CB|nr:MBL fold metallo-hydrolase [Methylocapsa acidiphila]
MKITIVGCGDAFGTGGLAHTCFRVDSKGSSTIVDFGASSISSWKRLGFRFDDVDAVVISHLHGDHFGGLPFLLLDCQFVERRTKPLLLIGPPGLGQRLDSALQSSFPDERHLRWGFPWRVEEIPARRKVKLGGSTLETFEVVHKSGGLSTGVRLDDGEKIFAYSGDTAWTDALLDLSAMADLFMVECYSGATPVPNHMDWPTLKSNLSRFSPKRIVATHLSASAMACRVEMEEAGLTIAHDGLSFDL